MTQSTDTTASILALDLGTQSEIMVQGPGLQRRRHIPPRILQQRDEIIGAVAVERVLEIEQALLP